MSAAIAGEASIGLPDAPRLDGKPFLEFGAGWALAADKNQWILCRRRMRQGTATWQPVAYVASDKRMLMRVMLRKGMAPSPDAQAAVHAFFDSPPHTFREWVEAICKERR